jgi:TRAP-type C4-dicarboxylate transport system permease small subunit
VSARSPSLLSARLAWLGDRISWLGLWLAAVALLAIVVLNMVNIVLRYLFFAAFSWAEEAMLYMMIFGVYAGAVSVAWQQAHIRIDAFLNFAPARWRKALDIVSTLLVAAILAPVLLASWRVANILLEIEQRSDALHLPMWIPQSVIPAALLLIIVMSLARIFVPTSGQNGDQHAPPAPF